MTKSIFSSRTELTIPLGTSLIRFRRTLHQFAILVFISSAVGCGIDKQGLGFSVDPSQLLQAVETPYQSYNLSLVKPYDTVTLHARGVSGTGATIDEPIVYGFDARYVTVNADGQLKAVAPVASTPVTATMTFGEITRVATVLVSVISDAPQQLNRLALEPNAGDSAKVAKSVASLTARATKRLRIIRESVGGTNMSAVLVSVSSADTGTVKITQAADNVTVSAVRPGGAMLYISTYAYGHGIRDSLPFVVGWPLGGWIGSYLRYDSKRKTQILDFNGGNFTVGMGACVVWFNAQDSYDLDIVFDDPTHVTSADSASAETVALCKNWTQQDTANGKFMAGNISPWRMKRLPDGSMDIYSRTRSRTFRKPGVYRYRSTLYGTTGTITVCDEKNDRTCAPENYQWGEVNP